MSFLFEKLKVYQDAVSFAEEIDNLIANAKGRVSFSVLDQLSRASLSISLNIAEGNGRWGAPACYSWLETQVVL